MNNNSNLGEKAKMLNKMVMRENFVDKDTNEYIYASMSQPPVKIIDKNGSDNELDFTVECPTCGSHVNFGKNMRMISGHIYCDSSESCQNTVYHELGLID